MKNRKNLFLLAILCLCQVFAFGQQADESRMKIEISVMVGKTQVKAKLTSAALSFNKPVNYGAVADSTVKNSSDATKERIFFMAIYLDRQSVDLMKAFIQHKEGLDGYLTMTDRYGQIPSRKIEFKSAVLDALSDQLALEPSNAYMTIKCSEMVIDGLKVDF